MPDVLDTCNSSNALAGGQTESENSNRGLKIRWKLFWIGTCFPERSRIYFGPHFERLVYFIFNVL